MNPDRSAYGPRPRESLLNALALLTTGGTLICCALPILLVALGLGGVVAGLVDAAPWLVTLTRYKIAVFVVSGLLLALAGWALYRPGRQCPADPRLARTCRRVDRWNRRVYLAALLLWAVGFAAAWLALPVARALGY